MPLLNPRSLPKSWKSTIRLPKTTFTPGAPVGKYRTDLLKKSSDDLYAWQQSQCNRKVFTLLDGPPYANGQLHLGHALNKILKDITCRFQLSQGKRVDWTPGWDCHGLPIELKALEQLKDEGDHNHDHAGATSGKYSPNFNSNSPVKDALLIRRAARKLAARTIEEQKKTFQSWGLMADWNHPWRTMNRDFEINQLEVFARMVKRGLIYRQRRPVYWSPSSRTALAEAELEYRLDHVSRGVFVRLQLVDVPGGVLVGLETLADKHVDVYALIWTTTPWTLPANRAIAVNGDLRYVVVQTRAYGPLLLAESRLEDLRGLLGEDVRVASSHHGSELVGLMYRDADFEVETAPLRPVLHGDFVSADSGTGLVHVAPGHGVEDYELGLQNNIPAFAPIDDAGRFTALASPKEPALLEGKDILADGTDAILKMLSDSGSLVAQHDFVHKYPYDWRSRQPVVLRATEQWFANVDGMQDAALHALDSVQFTPEGSKVRLQSFIKNRTEWCISRQRAWGVPIPALYNEATGEAVLTEESVSHIISVISERGTDAWWSDDGLDPAWIPPFLQTGNGQASHVRGKDTMDVWFDSGTSWTQAKTAEKIADMYLEGTDQHRGWFQSSLITSTAARESSKEPSQAPFRSLVTHGFALDEHGRKMSKSIGNVVSPNEIINGTLIRPTAKKSDGQVTHNRDSMGVDALRLWVASSDYTKDVSVSPAALKVVNSTLAKYRVTFKQLLGILRDYNPSNLSSTALNLNIVHKIALWQLENVEVSVRQHYINLEYHKAITEITRYINQDLSAFYFEIIKDPAYCGDVQERTEVQVACNVILFRLQQLLTPAVPLLIQETWEHTPLDIQKFHGLSPLQRTWTPGAEAPGLELLSDGERHRFHHDVPQLKLALNAVRNAQEQARSAEKMGSSLQCFVMIQLQDGEDASLFERYKDVLAMIFVVSKVDFIVGSLPDHVTAAEWSFKSSFDLSERSVVGIHVYAPQDLKCVRCWRYMASAEAGKKEKEGLCRRCEGVMDELRETRPELFDDIRDA